MFSKTKKLFSVALANVFLLSHAYAITNRIMDENEVKQLLSTQTAVKAAGNSVVDASQEDPKQALEISNIQFQYGVADFCKI